MPYFKSFDQELYDKLFHKMSSDSNGYVFLIIFRRKWLITNEYLSKEKATEYFPSSEMCLGKCLVNGNATYDRFQYKINQLLSILYDGVAKKMMFKGRLYELNELYKHFPSAISLMFTFPRDLKKATTKLLKKSFDTFMSEDEAKITNMIQHYDQQWISLCQATSDRKHNYGFIDIDYNIVSKNDENIEDIQNSVMSFLKMLELKPVYAVTTISGGLHVFVELNDHARKILFSKDEIIFKETSNFFQIPKEYIEIGTSSNKISHLPFNKRVNLIYPST